MVLAGCTTSGLSEREIELNWAWQDCETFDDGYPLNAIVAGCSLAIAQHEQPADHLAIAYNNRCVAQAWLHNVVEGITDCNEALRLKPDFASALLNRGEAYMKLGEQNRAELDFVRMRRLNPANAYLDPRDPYPPPPYLFVRFETRKTRDFTAAVELHSRIQHLVGVGISAHSHGQDQFGEKQFSEAIRLKPDYAEAYYHRAWSRLMLKRVPLAIDDMTTALTLEPNNFSWRFFRARLFNMNHQLDLALEDYDLVSNLVPERNRPYEERCRLRTRLGYFHAGLRDCEAAMRFDPQPHNRRLRACVLLALHRYDEALSDYTTLFAISDESPDHRTDRATALFGLGYAHYHLDEIDEGRVAMARAIELQPKILEMFSPCRVTPIA